MAVLAQSADTGNCSACEACMVCVDLTYRRVGKYCVHRHVYVGCGGKSSSVHVQYTVPESGSYDSF